MIIEAYVLEQFFFNSFKTENSAIIYSHVGLNLYGFLCSSHGHSRWSKSIGTSEQSQKPALTDLYQQK